MSTAKLRILYPMSKLIRSDFGTELKVNVVQDLRKRLRVAITYRG